MDDLVARAAAFHCSDETLELQPSSATINTVCRSKLVGKLFRPKKLGRHVVRRILMNSWELKHSWSLVEEKPNLFIFTFRNEQDRSYVLNNGPWSADGSLLLLRDWPPGSVIEQIAFQTVSLWAHTFGLPLKFFSEDNAKMIGNRVGRVHQVIVPKPRSTLWGRTLRFKVEVDIANPLVIGFFVKNDDGVPQWVQLKFDRLPVYCYKCGLLNHEEKSCSSKDPAMISDVEGATVKLYGNWARSNSPSLTCFTAALEPKYHPPPTAAESATPGVETTASVSPARQSKAQSPKPTGVGTFTPSTAATSDKPDNNSAQTLLPDNQITWSSPPLQTPAGTGHAIPNLEPSFVTEEAIQQVQAAMHTSRQKLRSKEDTLMVKAHSDELSETIEYYLLPSPLNQFQPKPTILSSPPGLEGIRAAAHNTRKRKVQPFMLPIADTPSWPDALTEFESTSNDLPSPVIDKTLTFEPPTSSFSTGTTINTHKARKKPTPPHTKATDPSLVPKHYQPKMINGTSILSNTSEQAEASFYAPSLGQ